MSSINRSDRTRLQSHLRTLMRAPTLLIDPAETQGGTAQIRVGDNVLGTVDQMDEEGERSWAVTLIVLAEDLAG